MQKILFSITIVALFCASCNSTNNKNQNTSPPSATKQSTPSAINITEASGKMIKISNGIAPHPKPVCLVGTKDEQGENYMIAAWFSQVNASPNQMMVAINYNRNSYEKIVANQAFSLSIPSANIVEPFSVCGMISGKDYDKSQLFNVFYDENPHVPLLREMAITMDCRVIQEVKLPTHALFVAEVKGSWVDSNAIANKRIDFDKLNPLLYHSGQYSVIGEEVQSTRKRELIETLKVPKRGNK